MRIGGITDMSTVDWYGEAALVVFFAGCNFRCPYCQNSGLLPLDSGQDVALDLIQGRIEEAQRPVETITAVVLTGGEPLLQPDAVIEVAEVAKDHGLKVMLDTNGSIPEALTRVVGSGLIDRVALDVKAPFDPVDYGMVSGTPKKREDIIAAIRETLRLCKVEGVELEARTTVAPGLSDDPEFIMRIARDIKGYSAVYYLQQFDNQGEVLSPDLKVALPPTKEKMIQLARAALDVGLENVYIKTRAEGLQRID